MLITMTRTARGSPNGAIVKTYEGGKMYDVPPDLGNDFVANGDAVNASKQIKAIEKAPETSAPVPSAKPVSPKGRKKK